MNAVMSVVGLIYILFIVGFMAVWIYGFVLFVKLAHRGIKALDIYIQEKTNRRND